MPSITASGRRIVVKIGSGLLRDPDSGLREDFVLQIVAQLTTLRQQGTDVVLVSSGALSTASYRAAACSDMSMPIPHQPPGGRSMSATIRPRIEDELNSNA